MSGSANGNNRIAKNTLFLYIRMGLVLLVSLYTTRVVLRVLGAEDYGIYNVVCGLVAMFGVLNTSLSSGINRFYNYEIGKKDCGSVRSVYNAAFRIQAIIAVIVLILVEIVGVWYLNNKMIIPNDRLPIANVIFQLSVISLVLSIIQTPYSAAIMAYEKMDYYAIVSIIDVLLKLGFVISLQFISLDKLLVYGVIMTFISLINFLLYYVYSKIRFKELKLTTSVDRTTLKSMSSFSVWMMLDPFAYMIRGQGCNMVLNLFRGPLINAAYAISNQVAVAVDQFTSAVSTAFRPQLMQSYSSGNYIRTRNLMYSMSKINFILELALSAPIIFEIDYILGIWLGDFPDYTITFTIFILLVKTINTFNPPITSVMMAVGTIKVYMILSFVVISSILPLTYLFLRLGYSPTTMYVIMLCLTIVNQIISIVVLQKHFDAFHITEYLKEVILPCLLQMSIVFLGVWFCHQFFSSSLFSLIILVTVSALLSFTGAYCLVFNKTEKNMIQNIANTFINKFIKRRNI